MGANLSKEEQLYQQVLNGNHDAVKALRRDGASLEWVDKEGRTPLIVACTRGELLDMLITLLKLGANMNAYKAGAHGGFPLHHAAKRGLDKTVTLLLSRGADPLALNDDGQTALDMARNRGHVSVVRLLEEKLSIFSENLREFSGFSVLESVAPQLVTKKVWAVVLRKESHPRRAPVYELAIYEPPRVSIWNGVRASPVHPAGLCNVSQPRTTLPLTKAEIAEPDFGSSDPVLCIMDKSRKTKLKFRSEIKGDKAQLDRFYQACKGVSEVQSERGPGSTTTLPASGAYFQGNPSQIHPIGALTLPVPQSASVLSPLETETAVVETGTAIPEEVAFALALDESIRTATEEGIPVSPTAFWCREDDHEVWDRASDGRKKWESALKKSTHQERKGNKSSPNSRHGSLMDARLSELQDCEEIASQVVSAPPSAPPLPHSAVYPNLSVEANIISTGMVSTSMQSTAGRACVVCWDAPVEGACIPCGHLAGCMRCLTEIKSHRWGCPVCRSDIGQVIKVYAV